MEAAVKRRACFTIACEAVATPFVSSILSLALHDPYSEYLPNRDLFRAFNFNLTSPFARFLDDMFVTTRGDPTLIGYTYQFAWKCDQLAVFQREVEDLIDTRVMLSSRRGWALRPRITERDLITYVNQGRVMTDILAANNARADGLVSLPFPFPFNIIVAHEWEQAFRALTLTRSTHPVGGIPIISFDAKTLVLQYVIPDRLTHLFPDNRMHELPHWTQWYVGRERAFMLQNDSIRRWRHSIEGFSGAIFGIPIRPLTQPRRILKL